MNAALLFASLRLCVFASNAQLPTNNLAAGNFAVMATNNGVLTAPTNFFAANSNLLNASIAPAAGAALLGAANVFTGVNAWTNATAHTGLVISNSFLRYWSNGAVIAEINVTGGFRAINGTANNTALGGLGNLANGINFTNATDGTNVVAFIIQQTNVANIDGGGFNGPGSEITGLNASQLASGTVPTARLGGGGATANTLLHGNNFWSAVSLSADVTGTLPAANGGANGGGIQIVNDLGTTPASTTSSNFAISLDGYLFWANGSGGWNGAFNILQGFLGIGHPYLMQPSGPLAPGHVDWHFAGNPSLQTTAHTSDDNTLRLYNDNPFSGSGSGIEFARNGTNSAGGSPISTNASSQIVYNKDPHALGVGWVGDAGPTNNSPDTGYIIMNSGAYTMEYARVTTIGGQTGNYPYMEWDGADNLLFIFKDTVSVFTHTNARFVPLVTFATTAGTITNNGNTSVIGTLTNTSTFGAGGHIWAGGTQLTYNPGGTEYLNELALNPTATIKITKIIPNNYTTAGAVMFDAGNNGSGLFFPSSDSFLHFANGGTDSGHIDASQNWTFNASITVTNSFKFSSGPIQTSGSGSPNSVVTAPVGSTYYRTDGGSGTTLYVKESSTGNTGWVGK